MKFRDWLDKQSQETKNTVYSFTEKEGEIYIHSSGESGDAAGLKGRNILQ